MKNYNDTIYTAVQGLQWHTTIQQWTIVCFTKFKDFLKIIFCGIFAFIGQEQEMREEREGM